MRRIVRPSLPMDPASVTERMAKDLDRGWIPTAKVTEFAIFYQQGEFHLFGSSPVAMVAARYDVSDQVAKELLDFADGRYKHLRGDQN